MTTTTNNVQHVIQNGMMNYSAYILLNRAIPRLEDGLKPVHRRILYTMYRQNAVNFTKSAHVSGETMKIHPHGDSYGSAVGLVQKDRHLVPMLTGKGNFGMSTSRDLQPAASRYTEIKLSEIAKDMMKDFDKNIVDFVDNYDGTIRIPDVLPVKYPSILTYAQSGIGVGFSSSTASFNMKEVIDATIKYINTKEHTVLIPDFATGGTIIKDEEAFKKINLEGSGSVQIRGKIDIEGNELIITEIPYTTTREAIIEKIIDLSKQGKLNEITDIKDLTGLKGMKILITCKKNVDKQDLITKLYKFTPLQSSHSSNMNILIDNLPKIVSVHGVIEKWAMWRKETIRRSLIHDVTNMKKKLHLLRGLEKVLLDIDKTIEIIRKSDEDQIEKNIMDEFNIDETQSKEIANMKLRNINSVFIIKKLESIEKFNETIEYYEDCLKDDKKIDQFVIDGLKESKVKYGIERRTKVQEIESSKSIKLEIEVPNYPVNIHLTEEGYLYKFRGDKEPTLKPGDKVKRIFKTMNKAELLIFSDENVCYKLPLDTVDENRINDLGHFIPNVLKDTNINIINYSILDDKSKILIAAYKNNRLAKINLQSFNSNRRILKNAYNKNQELVDLITLNEEKILKLKTSKTSVELNTEKLALTNSRNATGVYITRKGELEQIEMA
ncbi:DNA gyrase/topoisomerase IV subunit A [Staphylococcus equorum]|uniref:DNA topoisomerase (ATP-hydrolyzing) subunit A n=1 Tax=Staphylococcus equorum TaxID=246432 RepID=A0A9X4LC34_9STAP|nr:DNA topoisomerase (ATP-hydrolyzing) subunit A [Staphylococcus equorum]MDG0860346.1 DNA topoisomerase (ATP-hydrolyzing) subunit A [Staphylococcus equorum]